MKTYTLDAFFEIGTKEIVGPGSNPEVEKYLKTVGMPSDDDVPWCSAFVNWVITKNKIKGTGKANARSWLSWGEATDWPEIGDIVVLSRGQSKWQGHVGFFLDANNDYIYILGGNQSNRVGVNRYHISRLLGYRRQK